VDETNVPNDANATLRFMSQPSIKPADGDDTPAGEACLILIHGGELGRRYPLKGAVQVGRDADNEIVLDRSDVSRHHAAFLARGGTWYVLDLGSTNGTFVNDTGLSAEHGLATGDLVKVGGAILKYISGNDVEALFFDEIYRLTIYDGLTRVHNRRYFDEFLDRELARANRHARPLCLALLDIDHFKKLNDEHGHLVGDEVLRELAQRVQTLVRREELLARYGGEEFGLVIPEVGLEKAVAFCERVREAVSGTPFTAYGKELAVTISLGVAELDDGDTREDIVRTADQALYEAKRAGRNRVHVAPSGEE
jgi:two-component system cell cycle response regulator